MVEDSKIKIDKFDGNDYVFWKMQIEDLLYQKSLHLPMLGEQPDDIYDEEWKLLDRQALVWLGFLWQRVLRITLSMKQLRTAY